MSILNRPSDGIHSILVVLYNYLLHKRKAPRNIIIATCAPKTLIADQSPVRQTLNTWIDLGLFEEQSGQCMLSSDLPPHALNTKTGLEALPGVARVIVLTEDNNRNLWVSEESHSADFTRAISWLSAQDVSNMPGGTFLDVEALEQLQVKDNNKRIFQNDTRWYGLKAWAPFLGFGWSARKEGSEHLFIDPTVAVRESLSNVFQHSKELTAIDFIKRISQILPVLDGGIYRTEIESHLSPEHWKAPKTNEVSTSLSRSLRRLHFEGIIKLDDRADADKLTLLGRGRFRDFSHVIYGKEA
jgi:hypothetical protein